MFRFAQHGSVRYDMLFARRYERILQTVMQSDAKMHRTQKAIRAKFEQAWSLA
jgi:hypothetical protein